MTTKTAKQPAKEPKAAPARHPDAEELKARRESAGLTRKQVADELGCSLYALDNPRTDEHVKTIRAALTKLAKVTTITDRPTIAAPDAAQLARSAAKTAQAKVKNTATKTTKPAAKATTKPVAKTAATSTKPAGSKPPRATTDPTPTGSGSGTEDAS